jgi:hypothetical protein
MARRTSAEAEVRANNSAAIGSAHDGDGTAGYEIASAKVDIKTVLEMHVGGQRVQQAAIGKRG